MNQKTSDNKNPIVDLATLEYFRPFEGFQAKLIHTPTQTYAFWEIKKGAVLPQHQHVNEQVVIVTKGILELTIDNVSTQLEPGTVAVIPPNTDHSGVAITDVEVTDVFHPVRDDFPQ